MTNFNLRPHQEHMLLAMGNNNRGIIQCPTGGGKTFTFITDSRKYLKPSNVVVVVSPRLLLTEQLFNEFDSHLQDVDFLYREISSEGRTLQRNRKNLKFRITKPQSPTTNVDEIVKSYQQAVKLSKPLILFVTYDSLERILSAGIPVDVTYYDEAHNATSSDNFIAVKNHSLHSRRNFFFTATPKMSHSNDGAGMSNEEVYGPIISCVDFRTLLNQGIIVRPKLHLMKSDADTNNGELDINYKTIIEVIDYYETELSDTENHKLLFCTQGTKAIRDLIDSGLVKMARDRGYHVLTTDSVNGQMIDGEKVRKDIFLKRMNEIGDNPNEKMLVFHYSQIAEGIDVKSFTGLVFMRKSMSDIFTTQSIGRVIRSAPGKQYGSVTIVEHQSDTGEARATVEYIVRSLLEAGVPPEVMMNEEDGRGKDEEVVEELPNEIEKTIMNTVYSWEHSNMLSKLLQEDVSEFSF